MLGTSNSGKGTGLKAYLVSGDFDPLMAFVPLAGTLGLFMQKDEFLSLWLAAGTSTHI